MGFRLATALTGLILVVSGVAQAAPSRRAMTESHPMLYLGGGLVFQDAALTAVNTTGGTSLTSGSMFSGTLAGRFGLTEAWGLSPVLTYTPFGGNGADTGEKTRLLTLDVRLYRTIQMFDLHAGPGLLFDTVGGSGGTTQLDNGTGTATFGLPSHSSTSSFLYCDFGAGASISRFRIDLDFLITGLMSSRRAVDPMLTASVGLF